MDKEDRFYLKYFLLPASLALAVLLVFGVIFYFRVSKLTAEDKDLILANIVFLISIVSILILSLSYWYTLVISKYSKRQKETRKSIESAKSEFITLASHQLKTPLTSIRWYMDILLEDHSAIDKEQLTFLELVDIGSRRMLNIVDAMLDISRIKMGTFQKRNVKINIEGLMNDVLDRYRLHVEDKKLRIALNMDQLNKNPFGELMLLEVVLDNLVSNAVKYTPPEGAVEINGFLLKEGDIFSGKVIQGPTIGIIVEDTGYGVPDSEKDKVFNKLYRGENILLHDTDGTGLGLYLVKKILDYMNGDVWFESTIEEGTSFYVLFPVEKIV